jgi:hypothetical protein
MPAFGVDQVPVVVVKIFAWTRIFPEALAFTLVKVTLNPVMSLNADADPAIV